MIEIPNKDLDNNQKLENHTNLYLNELIRQVCIHIYSKPLTNSFYNFSDFYLKNKINDSEIKKLLQNKIIKLLSDKQYHLAYVFNKTGLVICMTEDDLDTSVWKSNLDFTKL
tara:strand:+ start:381 stop:716 length:336 start_codon:yes stop_codon:yes gene_type:complete